MDFEYDGNFITNIDKCQAPFYQQAIDHLGWGHLICINDVAWNLQGVVCSDMSSFWWRTTERKDLAEFYEVLNTFLED